VLSEIGEALLSCFVLCVLCVNFAVDAPMSVFFFIIECLVCVLI